MEFLFYYHYFSGWLLKYIYHFYLFIYFCIIFLHTNLPYFVKHPRAIVTDWALYKYFYYYSIILYQNGDLHYDIGPLCSINTANVSLTLKALPHVTISSTISLTMRALTLSLQR